MAYTTTSREFFETLVSRLNESQLRAVGGVVAFEVHGDKGGRWTLDLGRGTVADDDAQPDVIVSASERDFMALVEARMSVQDGLLTDRLVVAGDPVRLTGVLSVLTRPG